MTIDESQNSISLTAVLRCRVRLSLSITRSKIVKIYNLYKVQIA